MFTMFLNARRTLMAGLAICATVGACTVAADAGATISPPVPPPPGDAVLVKRADLVVAATTSTTVRVANVGRRAAGPFSIAVAKGYIGDACQRPLPAMRKDVASLAVGASKTITVPESSRNRTVTVDYLNAVVEANELNNTGTILGANIIC